LELIPMTIRSRCQIVKFNHVSDTQIVDYLTSIGQDTSNAQRIAGLCGGNIKHAKTLLDADFSEVDSDILNFWRIMMASKIENRWVTTEDIAQLIETYTAMAKTDPAAFRNNMRFMIFWLRDAQLLAASPDAKCLLINTHLIDELTGFINFYPAFPYFEMIRLIEETLGDVDRNMYVPALMANLFIELRTTLLETRKKR
ncbi:MAG: hypothetical protein KAT14_01075, partial [Candidatus Marinimicrobia bacterium]|nr:hypothetical protein [Candidatus Neomarinimicrobiota bacterium]